MCPVLEPLERGRGMGSRQECCKGYDRCVLRDCSSGMSGASCYREKRHLRRGRNSWRVIRSLIRFAENSASCRKRICPLTLRESFICLSPPGPVTIPRYAPFPVRGGEQDPFFERIYAAARRVAWGDTTT